MKESKYETYRRIKAISDDQRGDPATRKITQQKLAEIAIETPAETKEAAPSTRIITAREIVYVDGE
jgi:hypothetical protein